MEDKKPFQTKDDADSERLAGIQLRPRRRLVGDIRLQESDEALLAQMTANEQAILRCGGCYGEIAERLNISLGTVKSRLHRARVALQIMRQKASMK